MLVPTETDPEPLIETDLDGRAEADTDRDTEADPESDGRWDCVAIAEADCDLRSLIDLTMDADVDGVSESEFVWIRDREPLGVYVAIEPVGLTDIMAEVVTDSDGVLEGGPTVRDGGGDLETETDLDADLEFDVEAESVWLPRALWESE